MTVSDTHADTIREALGMAARMGPVTESEYVIPASTALDALVAERARERARADRAEAALAAIRDGLQEEFPDLSDDDWAGNRAWLRWCAQKCDAALSAGSGGRETTL